MPNYDYRCVACDALSTHERPLGDLEDQECPQCGAVSKRVFQVFKKQPEIGGGACSSHGESGGVIASLEDVLASDS